MFSILAAEGGGLTFPSIGHLLDWPTIGGTGINKPVLIYFFAVIITIVLFTLAIRRESLVPRGLRAVMESAVEFIEDGIIMPTMGRDGASFLPLLATLFFFIFFSNITEVMPFIHFPANARMAMPFTLAMLVFCVFIGVGLKYQGVGYFKEVLFPPGVPGALKPLVAVIELLSTFFIRPFSLMVRLFANMLAGHLLLVTFAVLAATMFSKTFLWIGSILPFAVLVGLTGFEILVAFLQAYIFTILTAVYIGSAMHPEH